jgi:hypothetical protein
MCQDELGCRKKHSRVGIDKLIVKRYHARVRCSCMVSQKMKKKPQSPKQKPNFHTTNCVKGLMDILKNYPENARIYAPDPDWIDVAGNVGTVDLEIWQGKKTLAYITLTGY